MELASKNANGVTVVTVSGRIDATTAPEFEKYLTEIIASGEKKLLINFRSLEYISSAGLRSILATAKKLKVENGELAFASLVGPVEEVFKISGFHSIFTIYETEDKALIQM